MIRSQGYDTSSKNGSVYQFLLGSPTARNEDTPATLTWRCGGPR